MRLRLLLAVLQTTIIFPLGTLASLGSTDQSASWERRIQEKQMIADFLRDITSIESIQTNSTILTPCHKISRDSSFTRSWTHEDWLQRK